MKTDNSMAANLVATRGNRCSATILGWMEHNVRDGVSDQLWEEMRHVVLDNVNSFKDLAIDIVKSDTAYINQVWMEKLDQLHADVRKLR